MEDEPKEYRVAWQSKASAARGVDDTAYTYDDAIKRADELNEQYPRWVHYVIKIKRKR